MDLKNTEEMCWFQGSVMFFYRLYPKSGALEGPGTRDQQFTFMPTRVYTTPILHLMNNFKSVCCYMTYVVFVHCEILQNRARQPRPDHRSTNMFFPQIGHFLLKQRWCMCYLSAFILCSNLLTDL